MMSIIISFFFTVIVFLLTFTTFLFRFWNFSKLFCTSFTSNGPKCYFFMQSGISVLTNFQVHHDPFEISGIADTIPLHFAADNFVSKSSFGSNRKIAVYNSKKSDKKRLWRSPVWCSCFLFTFFSAQLWVLNYTKVRTYKSPRLTNTSIVIRYLRGEKIYESNRHCPPGGWPRKNRHPQGDQTHTSHPGGHPLLKTLTVNEKYLWAMKMLNQRLIAQ